MNTGLGRLTIAPDIGATRTMAALDSQHSPLAVVEDGRVIGLVSQMDAMKWLTLR